MLCLIISKDKKKYIDTTILCFFLKPLKETPKTTISKSKSKDTEIDNFFFFKMKLFFLSFINQNQGVYF